MDNLNEDELIMYEENKEIKETLSKAWNLLNDKDLVHKILLKSSLLNEMSNNHSQMLLNLKENISSEKTNYSIDSKDKLQKGKFYLNKIFLII